MAGRLSRRAALAVPLSLLSTSARAFAFGDGGAFHPRLLRAGNHAPLGVLSQETRGAMESDLKSLVEGLENPDTLDVKVSGDSAVVEVPGGHQVKLRREAGVWRIQDFD